MAYQGRQISKGVSIKQAERTAAAGDPNVNAARTGEAIGAIGTELGDLAGKAIDGGKKKEPNKTNPSQLAQLEKAVPKPTFPNPIQPLESKGVYTPIEPNPRPKPSITNKGATSRNDNPYVFGSEFQQDSQPRGDWQGPLTHPTGPVHHVDQGTLAQEQAQQGPAQQGPSWYNPQHPGSGNINPAKSPMGRHPEMSPFKRTVDAGASDRTLGQAIGAAGTAIGDAFQGSGGGRPKGDIEQEKQALSYLGSAGRAATEASNRQIRRRNYKRQVWDNKRKEADEQFSRIQVEPSGVSSYDTSVQTMAMEWKKEAADLIRNKDQYDPYEYSAKLKEIENRSTEYNSASQNIQAVVADYAENIDNISPSTPPETIDILDTLSKGGNGLAVQNVNGIPTFVGQTLGGEDVSVPVSEIASGKNTFKFNSRVEVEPMLEGVVDDAFKFQASRATQMGLSKTQLGFDQLRPRIESKIDGMLKNDHQVRSILADQYGYDFDDYEDLIASGQDPKQFARELLMEDIQDRMAPKYAADQQTFQAAEQQAGINEAKRQRLLEEKQTQKGGSNTQSEREYAKNLERANTALTDNFNYSDPASYEQLGYTSVSPDTLNKDQRKALEKRYPDGNFVILNVNGKAKVLPTGGENSREIVARELFGVDPSELSPLQRKSPFKRLTNWMGITK